MSGVLLAVALAFTPQDAAFAFGTARTLVSVCTPRDAGTPRGRVAANYIRDMAASVGADVRRDAFRSAAPDGERTFTNLYAPFRTDGTNRWVVLVSHYDTKSGVKCPGANDGASTSALLVALAKVLASRKSPRGNVLLVWTDAEECVSDYGPNDGFQGSRRAVAVLAERKLPVQAVVCLDMLGDRDLAITIPANGTPALAHIARHAARRIGEPNLVTLADQQVKDDHVAFLEAGYKAIDLIDFSYGPDNAWWHTEADTIDKISESSLLKSGRLVCAMLEILL